MIQMIYLLQVIRTQIKFFQPFHMVQPTNPSNTIKRQIDYLQLQYLPHALYLFYLQFV